MPGSLALPCRLLCLAVFSAFTIASVACTGVQTTVSTPPPGQPAASQPGQATSQPSATKQPAKISVALDWYPWSNHTGLLTAKEKGYYQEEGLDVNIYVPSNPEDVLKLVGAGKDTFGISYQSDVLLAAAEGIPVKSVAALVQHPLNSVMTLKASGLTRPKQLEGKKVGYPGIPGHEALLATMMEKDGSSLSKVELVNVGFDLVPPLLAEKVDASLGAYVGPRVDPGRARGLPGGRDAGRAVGCGPTSTNCYWSPTRRPPRSSQKW